MDSSAFKTKLRQGDEVVVLAGSSKGEAGKIDRFDKKNNRVFVAGVNVRKKHVKPSATSDGGILDKPMSIHISNVAFVDPKSKKPTRLGIKKLDGRRVRVAKSSGTELA